MAEQDRYAGVYEPIPGGWRVWITGDPAAPRLEPGARIGVVGDLPGETGHEHNPDLEKRALADDPRRHRRPLYPPADRGLVWSPAELEKLQRLSFRPLVVAYNAPRFAFDFHAAGGLLGHLRLGLVQGEKGKWLDQWSELEVEYADGRLDYSLRDGEFPGVRVQLSATALAGAVGLGLRYRVELEKVSASLVFFYGGASAFFSNYAFGASEFAFAAGQCAKDLIAWEAGTFSLHRSFDQGDAQMQGSDKAPRHLPGWAALIQGGASGEGRAGFGDPQAAEGTPAALLAATRFVAGEAREQQPAGVAVQEIPLHSGQEGHLAVGMGGDIAEAVRRPAAAYRAGLARNAGIAGRVRTDTPDAHLDAAMTMMAFASEGIWGDVAFVHGGWSWRTAYLGWRTHYGPVCYGWADRARTSLRNHVRLGRITQGEDRGGLADTLEFGLGTYYNMNEVFLDHVRQYFDYTADLELMRELFPALAGVVEWESRRLQPGDEYLFESSLNTWISDSHWNIRGQCTQASAYMLQAHRFLADLAGRLGEDASYWREAAGRIHQALQRVLWQPRSGVFAEYRDSVGHGLLHPEPELPTLYHAAEFGAASPLQVYEMLHWADTHLESTRTAGGGRLFWSANWFPNKGRSYTHSTYEMAYAEELNFALTNYLAGRADQGYELLRACLCGIYNGPTPGGLSCHAYTDGRQRANDEFADAVSMWGRAVVEGLFGIAPKKPEGVVELCPQFPLDWPRASVRTPHFSYSWERGPGRERIEWETPAPTRVRLRLALRAERVEAVEVDGRSAAFGVEPGVGLTYLLVEAPEGKAGSIAVQYVPAAVPVLPERLVRAGEEVAVQLAEYNATGFLNPQGVLQNARLEEEVLRGRADARPGPGLLFLLAGTRSCPVWLPLPVRVEPARPAAPAVWSPPGGERDLGRWTLIDLGPIFNASVPQVLARVLEAARPPALPACQVGFGYWKEHMKSRVLQPPSDAAWRAKVDADGAAWTADGIPFKSRREGDDIGVATRAGGFPERLQVPVRAAGQALYLMVSGMTFPSQSHVVNVRLRLCYPEGEEEVADLVNPFGIGDCWGTWLGRFHDTAANGFENIGGRFGPTGSCQVADLQRPVAVDTEAHLIRLPLRPRVRLQALWFEAIANDAIFGLMGASVLK